MVIGVCRYYGLLVALAVAALNSFACSGPLRIEITEANPPTFILNGGGSGYLDAVLVKEYGSEKPGDNIWVVGPKNGSISLSHFHPTEIMYAELPNGWTQEIPVEGIKAPALIEGKSYQVVCHMLGVETRAAVFSIKGGKVVQHN